MNLPVRIHLVFWPNQIFCPLQEEKHNSKVRAVLVFCHFQTSFDNCLIQKMTELSGKNWDLSLYELHRTPQEAITDNKEITISPKVRSLSLLLSAGVSTPLMAGPPVRADLPDMSGDADLHHDHQGVSPQVLCGVYHHRPQIR